MKLPSISKPQVKDSARTCGMSPSKVRVAEKDVVGSAGSGLPPERMQITPGQPPTSLTADMKTGSGGDCSAPRAPADIHPQPLKQKELADMPIVPRPRAPFHTPTPPFAGRRWPCRVYPGELAQAAGLREDLRADLHRLEGLCPDLAETVVLCASEMFANACDHSLSGQVGGRVVRTLSMPAAWTLCLSVVDDGARTDVPTCP